MIRHKKMKRLKESSRRSTKESYRLKEKVNRIRNPLNEPDRVYLLPYLVFWAAQSQTSFLTQSQYLYHQNLFFGTNSIFIWDLYGTSNWYLSIGFFLPLVGGILGLLSLKSNK